MAVTVDFLQSVPYFFTLSLDELDAIKDLTFEEKAERGETILIQGEPAEVLYFVASGAVKVFKTAAEGREQILNIVRRGESFNDVPMFDSGSNPASVQAMGPVVLYGIRRNDLEIILRDNPQISLNVTKILARQARHLGSIVADLSFKHVIGRVAKILLENAGNGTGAKPRLTQQEMASMAGTNRQVVGRALKVLEEEGAIRLERHRIVIANEEVLKGMIPALS